MCLENDVGFALEDVALCSLGGTRYKAGTVPTKLGRMVSLDIDNVSAFGSTLAFRRLIVSCPILTSDFIVFYF
jgi:hypothetical protein